MSYDNQIPLLQLLSQIPILIVYVAGIILALLFWKRCPTSSLLSLIAIVVLLLITAIHPFVVQHIIHSREGVNWSATGVNASLGIVSMISSLLRTGAIALLIAAVFVNRKPSLADGLN
jgi:ABC-type phosphate transport system permease subunit